MNTLRQKLISKTDNNPTNNIAIALLIKILIIEFLPEKRVRRSYCLIIKTECYSNQT